MFKSTIFQLIAQFVTLIVGFLLIAISGRVLSTEDFGYWAIFLLFQGLVLSFANLGIDSFVISQKSTDSIDFSEVRLFYLLSSLFTLTLTFFAVLLFSPITYISFFLTLPIVIFFSLLWDYCRVHFQSHDDFVLLSKITICLSILKGGIGLLLLSLEFGVQSLSLSMLLSYMLGCLTFCVYRWNEKLSLRFGLSSLDFKLSMHICINRLISHLSNSLDKVFLPNILSISDLGAFNRAQQIALLPDANIRNPLTSFFIRMVSSNIIIEMKDVELAIRILCVPLLSVFFVGSDFLLPLFLGEKWTGYSSLLSVLCIFGFSKIYFSIGVIDTIVHRNQKIWSYVTVLYLIVCAISLYVYSEFLSPSLLSFAIIYSFISLIYWCLVWLFIRNFKSSALKLLFQDFLILSSTYFLLKSQYLSGLKLITLVFAFSFCTYLVFNLLYIKDKVSLINKSKYEKGY